ncbi:hydroxymethylpyrimidine/phosphomethylpyrimidine kinase [Fluviicola chungangensis]|uniref:hydroxymethylpyrimidine kinase n=1 Tax=Fluviicola chungangensis TaxID=2597671 RepID=A0A556MR36_9FLAO|nr:hydroxymethylpyrimidine/phosphomethylpyrimidine kinase [Fluviicola chungangensis]TSJ42401.1 hydroxymethylpyrimidine/phosphomethylpyrimidine kinase [Fluviicola chungangensis]
MKYKRPIVLSIAGFDPTGGAGVLADIKTCEQHRCLGMAVLTANTNQTETDFLSVDWFDKQTIRAQLQPILSTYEISAVKIGIVENLDILLELVTVVKRSFPSVPIIWDPVLAASSGFELHESWNEELLSQVLGMIDLITPNVNEVSRITGIEDEIEGAFQLAQSTHVLLKGGHSAVRLGVDLLFEGGIPREIPSKSDPETYHSKHGSGCILSSAIASNLAWGNPLFEACQEAKQYIEKRLSSNAYLLAYHVE